MEYCDKEQEEIDDFHSEQNYSLFDTLGYILSPEDQLKYDNLF